MTRESSGPTSPHAMFTQTTQHRSALKDYCPNMFVHPVLRALFSRKQQMLIAGSTPQQADAFRPTKGHFFLAFAPEAHAVQPRSCTHQPQHLLSFAMKPCPFLLSNSLTLLCCSYDDNARRELCEEMGIADAPLRFVCVFKHEDDRLPPIIPAPCCVA
jgi:hypothetical protein